MALAGERDIIFANFQAASGIENVDECISILEEHDWDLVASINAVVPDNGLVNPSMSRPTLSSIFGASPSDPPVVNLDPPVYDVDIGHMTEADSSVSSFSRDLKFVIATSGETLHITVGESERVVALKRHIEMRTGVAQSKQQLVGWPQAVTDQTRLLSLNLGDEVHLVLESDRSYVTPLAQRPCNLVTDGASPFPSSRPLFDLEQTYERTGNGEPQVLTLSVRYDGKDFTLPYSPDKTIRQVKTDMYSTTGIPVRNQMWTGWPTRASDSTTLAEAQLTVPIHKLFLEARSLKEAKNTNSERQVINVDTVGDASHDDSEPEEHVISDDDDDAIFGAGTSRSKQQYLIPPHSDDSSDVMVNFVQSFEERYGDCHPMFYMGPFIDAVNEASGQTAQERRPLLLYIHHDGSVLSNIFCSQVLCSETVVAYVNQNFVIWGWDVSHFSNKSWLVNAVSKHFGSIAATTIQGYRDEQFPLLLLVMKARSALEVCSVIEANHGLDEFMTTLMQGYEVFNQAKLVEVTEEEERMEREMMKKQQDQAYYESLAADRAKAEAEKQRQQAEADARLSAEMEAKEKEARRMDMENQLPDEPADDCTEDTTNILFRLPGGERIARKFYASDILKVVFIFIESKGFNMKSHKAVTNFPRRELTSADSSKTMKELSLCPQDTIFVEEL